MSQLMRIWRIKQGWSMGTPPFVVEKRETRAPFQTLPAFGSFAFQSARQWMCTDASKATTADEEQQQKGNDDHDASREEPERKKLVVVGGSGYVGSHIARYGLRCGLDVVCVSRSGGSTALLKDPTLDGVAWVRGDALEPERWDYAMKGAAGVVSCVGGFGSYEHARRICGETNAGVARVAHEVGVPRFVFVSAHMYNYKPGFLRGYYDGKKMAEQVVGEQFGAQGTILRPGFVYGTREVILPGTSARLRVPLHLIGIPLQVFTNTSLARAAAKLGGPMELAFQCPPTSVADLSKCAVLAATGYLQSPSSACAELNHAIVLDSTDIAHCAATT